MCINNGRLIAVPYNSATILEIGERVCMPSDAKDDMASTLLENGYARMTGRDATSSMEDAQEVSSCLVVLLRRAAVSCFRIRRVLLHPESNWAHELSLIL